MSWRCHFSLPTQPEEPADPPSHLNDSSTEHLSNPAHMCTPVPEPRCTGTWPSLPTPARAGLSPSAQSLWERSQGLAADSCPASGLLRCASSLGATAVVEWLSGGWEEVPRLHKEPDQDPQWHPQEPALGKKPANWTDGDSAQVDMRWSKRARMPACPLPGLGDLRFQQGRDSSHGGWVEK